MDFPKSARVRYRREYLDFFKGSNVKRLGSSLVFSIPSQKGCARLGMTIKAKVNSVYRNKLKRQVRESFRNHRATLPALDYNIVIPAPLKVNHQTPALVRAHLDAHWGS